MLNNKVANFNFFTLMLYIQNYFKTFCSNVYKLMVYNSQAIDFFFKQIKARVL